MEPVTRECPLPSTCGLSSSTCSPSHHSLCMLLLWLLPDRLPSVSGSRTGRRLLLHLLFTAMSSSVVLASVSHMFHVQGRSASTVSTYVATLADPSWCHFRLPLDDGFEALLRSGLFLPHPPTRRPPMFWSRRLVLPFLRGPTFASPVSALVQLRKAFFWWIWRQFYVLPSSST